MQQPRRFVAQHLDFILQHPRALRNLVGLRPRNLLPKVLPRVPVPENVGRVHRLSGSSVGRHREGRLGAGLKVKKLARRGVIPEGQLRRGIL